MDQVYYAGIASPIGTIWAAATEEGLLQVNLSRSEENFMESVKRRIDAEFIHDTARFEELGSLLKAYFNGERVAFDLRFDLRGTEFQRAVWRAMRRIPYGRLSSYGRLAAAIGRPRAARAVGNAVGANPLGIIIPCHRVIRSDGSLGGFGGGLNLKCYLLGIEGVLPRTEGVGIEDPKTRDDLRRYFDDQRQT